MEEKMETLEKAFKIAEEINKFFQQSNTIGIVDGTERNKEATVEQRKQALFPIDYCAVGDFGACNRFRNPRLLEVKIPVHNAVFDSAGESLAAI